MPPHHWLRFGFRQSHVIDYFQAVGKASGLPLIVHVYPAWTKASFSSELLAELAQLSWVYAFKIGTREMNKYARDLQAIGRRNRDVVDVTERKRARVQNKRDVQEIEERRQPANISRSHSCACRPFDDPAN